MRALQIIGLDETGTSMVCKDPKRGERFSVRIDERLREAVRGGGEQQPSPQHNEVETPMRPREIQSRIRAGQTVADIATAASLPVERVERFAYPVLLERARTAELAQAAHPVREDGPDVRTLGEVAAHAFSVRSQNFSDASWDAWRREDGRWIVSVDWQTGHSDNRALWAYSPGAHGGTVTALDEHAEAMLRPEHNWTPRAVEAEEEPEQDEVAVEENDEREDTGAGVLFGPAPTEKPAKKARPAVPTWEDVLLGVKSSRG